MDDRPLVPGSIPKLITRLLRACCAAVACLIVGGTTASGTTLSAGGMRGVPVMVEPESLFHTLAADFFVQPDGTVYVQTGDIPAMWLRDAAAQTLPYVQLARRRPALRALVRAVIARESRNIEIDPYANAFRANYRIWERKWELDSLAFPVVLAWTYDDTFGDRRIFTPSLHRALARVVETYGCEIAHAACSHYRFGTSGSGEPPAAAVGLIWSAFRASDDATRYPYNVPEELFASTALRDLAGLAKRGYGDEALADRASALAQQVSLAAARYGIVASPRCGGTIFAYEVDGRGRFVTYDDANLPSLLGMPLLGSASVHDPVYRRTRACVLSSANRFFYTGRFASGVGSPHTPRGYVWPLAIMARALTSTDRAEVIAQLQYLADSASAGGRIHESFDPNDPARFTRAEFGWANAMYAELLFRAAADVPAQRVAEPAPGAPGPLLPESIAVVDRATALANRAALLAAFDRAVGSRAIAPHE